MWSLLLLMFIYQFVLYFLNQSHSPFTIHTIHREINGNSNWNSKFGKATRVEITKPNNERLLTHQSIFALQRPISKSKHNHFLLKMFNLQCKQQQQEEKEQQHQQYKRAHTLPGSILLPFHHYYCSVFAKRLRKFHILLKSIQRCFNLIMWFFVLWFFALGFVCFLAFIKKKFVYLFIFLSSISVQFRWRKSNIPFIDSKHVPEQWSLFGVREYGMYALHWSYMYNWRGAKI